MLPLTKSVSTGSAANTAEASPEKIKADKVLIATRSSGFHAAASSAQRFNVNRVKRKFFSFAYWDLFRMKEMVSALPPRMEKQFSFANPIAIHRVALLSGPLPLKLESNDL